MGNRRTEKDGNPAVYEVGREGFQEAMAAIAKVDHPAHYGGDTTYEVIKVIEAWDLGFCLGNTLKYIRRCGRKAVERGVLDEIAQLEDLQKAAWYLNREIENLKAKIDG